MSGSVAGSQFDILDKAVAARAYELYARDWIYREDYDEWNTLYNQLQTFAQRNSNDSYVRSQWAAEEPRYVNAPKLLASKIRIANPQNYDNAISISGGCGCGSKLTPITNSPVNFGPLGHDGGLLQRGAIPTRGNQFIFGWPSGSIGDAARNLFNPTGVPYITPPSGIKQLAENVGHDTLTGILVAITLGVVLWTVHYMTKKKININA